MKQFKAGAVAVIVAIFAMTGVAFASSTDISHSGNGNTIGSNNVTNSGNVIGKNSIGNNIGNLSHNVTTVGSFNHNVTIKGGR